MHEPQAALADWHARALALEQSVTAVVIGQPELIRLLLVALFARGHVLLEGDVGVGKTTVLRALARAVGGEFERVEGTVDLMPGDLVYHTFVDAEGRPRIEPGPLLRRGEALTTFFFNEINRARPQVQSLLLRAMAERTVSAFGRDWLFPQMTVFADRNRVEREETFELASAARDRFMFELTMRRPADRAVRRALLADARFHDIDALIDAVPSAQLDWRRLGEIGALIQRHIHLSEAIEDYALALWEATEAPQRLGIALPGVDMDRLVLAGASPRGMSALLRAARVVAWLRGRGHVEPDDVREVLQPVLAHRIFFAPAYELRRAELAGPLIDRIAAAVAAP
ncbi:AAA family ATPase [Caldimonas sp. KR1-144]|uniref:AAA family ATPase n=1 Tax=Caldimonas sp. KR1-144 TaxID=3400911 RepID=UPI003C01AF47